MTVSGRTGRTAERITMTHADHGTAATGAAETVAALDALDWAKLAAQLDGPGFALTPPLLSPAQCADMIRLFEVDRVFRSTVVMARHQFGEGRYRYFGRPLVPLEQALRTEMYP